MSDQVAVKDRLDISEWRTGVDYGQEWLLAPSARQPKVHDFCIRPREWTVQVRPTPSDGDSQRLVEITLTPDDVQELKMQLDVMLEDMQERDAGRLHLFLNDGQNPDVFRGAGISVGQCTPHRAQMTRHPAHGPVESSYMRRNLLESARRLAGVHHGGGIDE